LESEVTNKGDIRRTEQMARYGWPDHRTSKFKGSAQRGRVRCVSAPSEVLVERANERRSERANGKHSTLNGRKSNGSRATGGNGAVGASKVRGKKMKEDTSTGAGMRRRSRADDFTNDRVLPADTKDAFGRRSRSVGKQGKFDDASKPLVHVNIKRAQNPLTRNTRFLGGSGKVGFSTEYGREFSTRALQPRAWA
jgi:hypothetical protein